MAEPAHLRARRTLSWALRVGFARRFSCFACCSPHAKPHQENREKPLEVLWYCDRCWRHELKDRPLRRKTALADLKWREDAQRRSERIGVALEYLATDSQRRSELVLLVRSSHSLLSFIPESSPLFVQRLADAYFSSLR